MLLMVVYWHRMCKSDLLVSSPWRWWLGWGYSQLLWSLAEIICLSSLILLEYEYTQLWSLGIHYKKNMLFGRSPWVKSSQNENGMYMHTKHIIFFSFIYESYYYVLIYNICVYTKERQIGNKTPLFSYHKRGQRWL